MTPVFKLIKTWTVEIPSTVQLHIKRITQFYPFLNAIFTIRHGGRSTACRSENWEHIENPVKTTKISGYTKIASDERAPAFNTAKFWNNHGLLPEVDLGKFVKKSVSTPVEAPEKVETSEKVETPNVETTASKSAPKSAPKSASKKSKKGKVRK